MDAFQKVALKEEITPKRPKIIMLDEFEIVLFRVGEEIFAIENLCPHQQFSVFHQGVVDGYTITCPMHSWSFDLRTGNAVAGSGRVKIFQIRIDGDSILVMNPKPAQRFSKF